MEQKELNTETLAETETRQALQQVKVAEERARQMVEEARSRTAPGLLKQAADEADEIKKRILAEARLQAEKLKREIIEQARTEAGVISQQTEAEKIAVLKTAEASFERAVEKTAARLLEIIESRKA